MKEYSILYLCNNKEEMLSVIKKFCKSLKENKINFKKTQYKTSTPITIRYDSGTVYFRHRLQEDCQCNTGIKYCKIVCFYDVDNDPTYVDCITRLSKDGIVVHSRLL